MVVVLLVALLLVPTMVWAQDDSKTLLRYAESLTNQRHQLEWLVAAIRAELPNCTQPLPVCVRDLVKQATDKEKPSDGAK